MSTKRTRTSARRRGLALVAAGLVATGAVSACSPENVAEQIIESGTDGNVDVEIDNDGGQITIESDEGSATFGSDGSLPDGFPDSVPVISGDIIFSQSMSEGGSSFFSVTMRTSGTVDDVFGRITSDLENAGFEKAGESTVTSDGVTFSNGQFTSAEWEVFVNVTDSDEDGIGVTYTVSSVE